MPIESSVLQHHFVYCESATIYSQRAGQENLYRMEVSFSLPSPRFARAYVDGSNYFILLIITDGVISDMEMTKQAVITVRNQTAPSFGP